MIRRVITLILMGAAFYGGLKVERSISAGRCVAAGGAVTDDGLCVGASR